MLDEGRDGHAILDQLAALRVAINPGRLAGLPNIRATLPAIRWRAIPGHRQSAYGHDG